jgi:hypothetical protein
LTIVWLGKGKTGVRQGSDCTRQTRVFVRAVVQIRWTERLATCLAAVLGNEFVVVVVVAREVLPARIRLTLWENGLVASENYFQVK